MMLHGGDDNLIPSSKVLTAIGLRNEIDRLGSAPYKNNLASIPRTDEALDRIPGGSPGFRTTEGGPSPGRSTEAGPHPSAA